MAKQTSKETQLSETELRRLEKLARFQVYVSKPEYLQFREYTKGRKTNEKSKN